MRVRLGVGRGALLAAGTAVALIATCPARLVLGWLRLDALGVSAREVRGTMWSATAAEARLGGLPLGDLRLALDPLPLLWGRARLAIAGEGDARGSVTVTRHRLDVSADGWRLPAGARLRPLPIAAVALDGARARFRDGLCEAAEGSARLELAGDPFGLGLPASLAGPLRCDGGALLLDAAGGDARLRLALTPAAMRATMSLRPGDPAAAARLPAAGFALAPDGRYALDVAIR